MSKSRSVREPKLPLPVVAFPAIAVLETMGFQLELEAQADQVLRVRLRAGDPIDIEFSVSHPVRLQQIGEAVSRIADYAMSEEFHQKATDADDRYSHFRERRPEVRLVRQVAGSR